MLKIALASIALLAAAPALAQSYAPVSLGPNSLGPASPEPRVQMTSADDFRAGKPHYATRVAGFGNCVVAADVHGSIRYIQGALGSPEADTARTALAPALAACEKKLGSWGNVIGEPGVRYAIHAALVRLRDKRS